MGQWLTMQNATRLLPGQVAGRKQTMEVAEVEAAKGRGQMQWALKLFSPDKLCDHEQVTHSPQALVT